MTGRPHDPNDPMPKDLYELAKALPNYIRDGADFRCEKEIGRGGFGVVWLGTDLKTNKRVAVKEFLSSRLSQAEMRHYIREIYTIAVANTQFVVELIGFTVKPPYTIITKYEENGQFSKYIKSHRRQKGLSGSKLTIAAICMAEALMNFEKHHIIHRDLKSSNILLNENMLPIICDFGTSKILYPNCPLTKKIGTINYMPPEVYSTDKYNHKADVYGYGMILFEMAEGKIPFADYKREELIELIPTHTLQLEFKRSTKEMKNFILSCTNLDPDQRPTILECYQTFASGKLSFPGAKKKKVQKIVDMVQKDIDSNWSKPKQIPPISVDINQIIKMLDEQRHQEVIEDTTPKHFFHSSSEENLSTEENDKPSSFDFKQIEDPTRPDYMVLLDQCKSEVRHSNYAEFAFSIHKAILKLPPENICLAIYSVVISLIKRHPSIIPPLVRSSFYQVLSLETDKLRALAIDLYGCLFQYHPEQAKISLAQPISTLINFDAESMITILSAYLYKLPPVDEVFPIINIYNENLEAILNNSKAAQHYVECLYFLLMNNSFYKEHYLKDQSEIIMKCCSVSDENVAIAALNAIAALLPDPNVYIDYQVLIEVAKNENLRMSLISVLLRIESYPPSRHIALLLITFATVSNRSFLSLMNFCSSSDTNAEIVANLEDWMETPIPTVQCTMKLFLLLFKSPKCRHALINSEKYIQFLKLCVESKDIVLYCYIPSIIKRSKENSTLVSKLHEFLRIYFNIAIQSDDVKILNAALVLADGLSDICYIPEIVAFIPTIKFILKNYTELTKQAITVLVRLSFLEEARPYLKPYVEYFQSIQSLPNFTQYSTAFLNNLQIEPQA